MQCLGGQKRTPDPLELGLQTVVSHHVGAEKQTWVVPPPPPAVRATGALNY